MFASDAWRAFGNPEQSLSEQWTRAKLGTLAVPMANKIPSGKKVLGYSLGTFLIAFPAMILVYRMMS
jgi:hypothetical protein